MHDVKCVEEEDKGHHFVHRRRRRQWCPEGCCHLQRTLLASGDRLSLRLKNMNSEPQVTMFVYKVEDHGGLKAVLREHLAGTHFHSSSLVQQTVQNCQQSLQNEAFVQICCEYSQARRRSATEASLPILASRSSCASLAQQHHTSMQNSITRYDITWIQGLCHIFAAPIFALEAGLVALRTRSFLVVTKLCCMWRGLVSVLFVPFGPDCSLIRLCHCLVCCFYPLDFVPAGDDGLGQRQLEAQGASQNLTETNGHPALSTRCHVESTAMYIIRFGCALLCSVSLSAVMDAGGSVGSIAILPDHCACCFEKRNCVVACN
jgi:hypothetical protein